VSSFEKWMGRFIWPLTGIVVEWDKRLRFTVDLSPQAEKIESLAPIQEDIEEKARFW
jgi:hypothetical protein